MKIIQRYFTANLVRCTALALAVLVGIFAFLSLIDQLEDSGQGNYGAEQAILYVLLTLPRLAYEIMPIAAMIGAMACLALLARNRELDIIRLAGGSQSAVNWFLGKAALVVVLGYVLLGEYVVPATEIKARHQRSIALQEQIAMQTGYGFWARDGNSFINIRRILPGNVIEEISIYEFDKQDRLRSSITARSARFSAGRWVLEGVDRTIIDNSGVSMERHNSAAWESWVDDDLLDLIIINPLYTSVWNLRANIQALKANAQSTAVYEQALYGKLVRPFTILAMVLLSVPLVVMREQGGGPGQQVFTGALVGVLFYFVNSASGHIGIVYGVYPLISAALPTLLLYVLLFRFYRHKPALSRSTDHERSGAPYQTDPKEIRRQVRTRIRPQEKTLR